MAAAAGARNRDELSDVGQQVWDILARHTAFPGAILTAQCNRLNLDPRGLAVADVRQLAEPLGAAVARFTSPQKGELVVKEILATI